MRATGNAEYANSVPALWIVDEGGDGMKFSALPDLRGPMPEGMGTGSGVDPEAQVEKEGNNVTTMTVAYLPAHKHSGTLKADTVLGEHADPLIGCFL